MNNRIMNSLVASAVTVVLCLGTMAQTTAPSSRPSFKAGQMWSYKTRPNEARSTFIVLKVDTNPRFGNIIHIAVQDLKMKNPHSPDGISKQIGHMPFSEKALAQSALKLLKDKVELPDFERGYNMWRESFEQQRAGFYTISIAEAVSITEEGLNR